jgi:transposase
MLLPPSLQEWVEDDDLAHFILEAVESTDTRSAGTNLRVSGSEQYPPGMMLALLIYSYATGLFSSRKIESATYRNTSILYPCGNHRHRRHQTRRRHSRDEARLDQESPTFRAK